MSDLIAEIKDARRQIHEANTLVEDAQILLAQRRAVLAKARALLEEHLVELEQPGTRYPLLDRPNGQPLEPTADEHQRGPTDTPAIAAAKAAPKPRRPRYPVKGPRVPNAQ